MTPRFSLRFKFRIWGFPCVGGAEGRNYVQSDRTEAGQGSAAEVR